MQAYWIEILLSLGSVAVFVYLLASTMQSTRSVTTVTEKGTQEQVVALFVVVLVKCLISNLTAN